MKDKQYFERNITLSYIIGCLMWGRFTIPILALFYIASQVTLEQFTIIMAVFSFSTLILEIPTGVIADLLGKKKALLISRAMYVIEIALIAFFNGFWIFLIAKIISGIGVSFTSGTASAFTYDSLKKLRREKDHKKVLGLGNTLTKISSAVVFILGAYLFSIHYKLPAILSLPLVIIGFLLTLLLKEPYPTKKKMTMKNSLEHLKEGLGFFKKNYYLKYLAFLTFFIGSVISIFLSLSSKYFELVLVPVAFIGIIAFVMNLLGAYSSKNAHKIEYNLGEKKSIYLVAIIIALIGIFISFLIPYIGVVFFLLLSLTQGFYDVIIGDYLNTRISTSHRATLLSINNMFDNIGITLLFPIIGFLSKSYSMKLSLMYYAGFIVLCSLLVIVLYKNTKK